MTFFEIPRPLCLKGFHLSLYSLSSGEGKKKVVLTDSFLCVFVRRDDALDIIIDDIDWHFDKVKFRKIEQMMQMVEGEKEGMRRWSYGKP